eukprot:COSAG06_NODE_2707_length_6406_cov_2.662229_8_plen_83_part_00
MFLQAWSACGSRIRSWKRCGTLTTSPPLQIFLSTSSGPHQCISLGIQIETGRPILSTFLDKRLDSNQNGRKFECRRVLKPFL